MRALLAVLALLAPMAEPQAVSRVQEDACTVCICSYKANQRKYALDETFVTVDCRNQNLLEIPTNIPTDVEVLDLGNNAFIRIEPEDFASLVNLKKLYINGNDIKLLHSGGTSLGVFSSLTELEEIDFSMNLLTGDGLFNTENGVSVFQSLTKLKYLDLSRNQIDKLPPMMAVRNCTGGGTCTEGGSGLVSLETLKLGTNLFHKQPIPISSVSNLTTLTTLSMDGNHFEKEIPDFSPLYNLKVLDLSFNRLQGVIPESMMNMSNL